MSITVTYSDLRKVKDALPDGSMQQIAQKLQLNVETVRNFFGGHNFEEGECVGIHYGSGPNEGFVIVDDTTIWDEAWAILEQSQG